MTLLNELFSPTLPPADTADEIHLLLLFLLLLLLLLVGARLSAIRALLRPEAPAIGLAGLPRKAAPAALRWQR